MKLEPLGDRVVIKASVVEEKKYGSIIIPDTAKEKPQTGEIVAVGNGDDLAKLNLKVGDQVIYAKYGGTEISLDHVEYMILSHSDVLAKVV